MSRTIAIIQLNEPHIDLDVEIDNLDLENISDNTLALLYAFMINQNNDATADASSNQRNNERAPDEIDAISHQLIALDLEDDDFDENTIIQLFGNSPSNILGPVAVGIAPIFDTSNDVADLPNVIAPLNTTFAGEINAFVRNLKFDLVSERNIPTIHLRFDGNIAVEMPYIEGWPKTTYISSQEMCSNLLRGLVSSDSVPGINHRLAQVDTPLITSIDLKYIATTNLEQDCDSEINGDCSDLSFSFDSFTDAKQMDDAYSGDLDSSDNDSTDSSECEPISPSILNAALYQLYHSQK